MFAVQGSLETNRLRQAAQRPGRMTSDQGFGIVESCLQRADCGGVVAVAQSDGDITQQTTALGTPYRRAPETGPKAILVQP